MSKVTGSVLLNYENWNSNSFNKKAGPWADCEIVACNHRSVRVFVEIDGEIKDKTFPLKFVVANAGETKLAGDTTKFSDFMVSHGLWNGDLTDMRPRSQQTQTTIERRAPAEEISQLDLGAPDIETLDLELYHMDEVPDVATPDMGRNEDEPLDESFTIGTVTLPFKPSNKAGMMFLLAAENSPAEKTRKLYERFETAIQEAATEGETSVVVGEFYMRDEKLVARLDMVMNLLAADGFVSYVSRVHVGEPMAEFQVQWDVDSIRRAHVMNEGGSKLALMSWD